MVDVQIQTSVDDGKGNSGFFIYTDKTIFRISPKKQRFIDYSTAVIYIHISQLKHFSCKELWPTLLRNAGI